MYRILRSFVWASSLLSWVSRRRGSPRLGTQRGISGMSPKGWPTQEGTRLDFLTSFCKTGLKLPVFFWKELRRLEFASVCKFVVQNVKRSPCTRSISEVGNVHHSVTMTTIQKGKNYLMWKIIITKSLGGLAENLMTSPRPYLYHINMPPFIHSSSQSCSTEFCVPSWEEVTKWDIFPPSRNSILWKINAGE